MEANSNTVVSSLEMILLAVDNIYEKCSKKNNWTQHGDAKEFSKFDVDIKDKKKAYHQRVQEAKTKIKYINNYIKDYDEEEENDENYGKKYLVEDFSFRLMTQDNEEFFYFSTKDNFIYSDTYINFESKLTSDNIYGFGERTHDFKLNEGIYTIWPYDCGGTKYDDGLGGLNQ